MSQASPLPEVRISADSHVVEPPDLWEKRLPAKYRDRAPKPKKFKIGDTEDFGVRPGGWDPLQRLKDMATDGISAEVLFPGSGPYSGRIHATNDVELTQACVQVYNDWIVEFCSQAPERLWGQAEMSLWDIEWAVKELERAKKAGVKGVTVWVAPPQELPWASDHYERFWSACEDLDMPVSMHIHSYHYPPHIDQRYTPGFLTHWKRATYGHKAVAMDALIELTYSGVFERHPRIKLLLAEFECGWIPSFLEDLDRMLDVDHEWNIVRFGQFPEARLTMLPSEYISRQVYSSFMQDSVAGFLLQRWGADNFVYANNYPLSRGIWPYTDDTIELTLSKLPAETRRKVLAENIAKVFSLPIPEPMPRQGLADHVDAWGRDWIKRAGEFSFEKAKMGLAV